MTQVNRKTVCTCLSCRDLKCEVAAANKGAKINALVNRGFAEKNAALTDRIAKLREAAMDVCEWMMPCKTNDKCPLCELREALATDDEMEGK